MDSLSTPRFILSGVRSGVGKSIVAIGLTVALRKRNVGLSCCVVGADAAEALVLRRLSRRYVRALDARILSHSQLVSSLQQASIGADLIMIEGRGGLFDGSSAGSLRGSDAELAALTRTPVVLVADSQGFGNSLAALIKGYSDFAQGFSIMGVIANRAQRGNGAEVRDKIYFDAALQAFGMPALLGSFPELDGELPDMREKFSQSRHHASLPLQFFIDVGQMVGQHVDLDELVARASKAPLLRLPEAMHQPSIRKTRIAVSDDNCFSLGFQDNLDLLRFYGAEIVAFSPLADSDLPKRIGAVYLTGATLQTYAQELSNNSSMRASIKSFADGGGIIYAEGAGAAYLCNHFQGPEDDQILEGAGVLPGTAMINNAPFSYCEAVTVEDSILGQSGLIIKGVHTGEWRLKGAEKILHTLRISNDGQTPTEEGYSPGAQIVATFSFPHWGSNPGIAKNIVDAAEIGCKI